jgi:hypothetical protein
MPIRIPGFVVRAIPIPHLTRLGSAPTASRTRSAASAAVSIIAWPGGNNADGHGQMVAIASPHRAETAMWWHVPHGKAPAKTMREPPSRQLGWHGVSSQIAPQHSEVFVRCSTGAGASPICASASSPRPIPQLCSTAGLEIHAGYIRRRRVPCQRVGHPGSGPEPGRHSGRDGHRHVRITCKILRVSEPSDRSNRRPRPCERRVLLGGRGTVDVKNSNAVMGGRALADRSHGSCVDESKANHPP